MDLLKLAAPLFTAILMVWIKGWIESFVSKCNNQRALSRLLHDEIINSNDPIEKLKKIATSASKGNLRLVALDDSTLIIKFALELARLDHKRSYRYSTFASSVEIVNKGIQRLTNLMFSRIGTASIDVKNQIDKVIIAQTFATSRDYVKMCEAALAVIKAIPYRRCFSRDPQTLLNLENAIKSSEKICNEWPQIVAQQDAQPDSEKAGGADAKMFGGAAAQLNRWASKN